MASERFDESWSVDMRDFSFEIDRVQTMSIVDFSSTMFRGRFSDGTYVAISGERLSYDASTGLPAGGEIHTFTLFWPKYASITGLHLAAEDLFKVALTTDRSDDVALVKAIMSGNDSVYGSRYADVLLGYNGDDVLSGRSGKDKLYGGNGNDLLYGGAGHDYLTGESGSDTFAFRSISDSTYSSAGRDTIYDFSSQDKIDLASIDANQKLNGNQAFTYIGKAAFHGVAGELRFDKQASDTYIYGDVNGDKKVDFAIKLDDAVDIYKAFFIL